MPRGYLTAPEIADRLRVSAEAVYRWARRGELPGAVRIAGTLRVDLKVFDEFLRTGGQLVNRESSRNTKPALSATDVGGNEHG